MTTIAAVLLAASGCLFALSALVQQARPWAVRFLCVGVIAAATAGLLARERAHQGAMNVARR
jgi:hypothetical protein